MRAALLHELGGVPALASTGEPAADADVVLALGAAALNPVDVAIGSGRYFGGHPPLPYTVGCEGVGRVVGGSRWPAGTRVYTLRSPTGTLAERFTAGRLAWELPEGDDDEIAAALGIAGLAGWLAVAEHACVGGGDRVLVLGATGVVGHVAVQAARILGAARVVAAGRDAGRLARARTVGADETVELRDDLRAAIASAFPDGGPDVVVDPLWGAPGLAGMEAAAPNARVVNLGQSAGASIELASALVRGKPLRLLGFSVFSTAPEASAAAHRTMLEHARAGRLEVEVERYPLAAAADAWRAVGAGRKPVVVPG